MSEYKWSFLVSGWLSLHVSRGKHTISIYFNQKCKKIQLKINNEIIKLFKASNKAFEGMSDYKWTFLVNGWLLLRVSRGKHLFITFLIRKYKKIQLKINNEIIKPFKASNKAFKGIGYYKWTFLVNRWLSLHVSQDKHLNIIYFNKKCKKINFKKNNELVKQF